MQGKVQYDDAIRANEVRLWSETYALIHNTAFGVQNKINSSEVYQNMMFPEIAENNSFTVEELRGEMEKLKSVK